MMFFRSTFIGVRIANTMKIVKVSFPRILLSVLGFLAMSSCHTRDIELKTDRDYAIKCEFVLDQVYFGMKMPNGKVSEEEWKRFLEAVISKKFPAGFTVIDGYGQWRGVNNELTEENTRVLQIAHENRPEENRKVEEIIEEYKLKFKQESVLRITTCSWLEF